MEEMHHPQQAAEVAGKKFSKLSECLNRDTDSKSMLIKCIYVIVDTLPCNLSLWI